MKSKIAINKLLFVLLLASSVTLLTYCGKGEEKKDTQSETPKTEVTKQEAIKTTSDTLTQNQAGEQLNKGETEKNEQTVNAVDLKGTYSGTFDSRPTTLVITEQTGNTVKGKITINYREVINQQVSGEFNPDTKTLTMKDLLHSRYAGKYSGKVSEDMKKYSGTFTMTVGGTKLTFNLAKK